MKRYFFPDKSSLAAAASMLLALVLSPTANVQAAELQVLAGGAMTAPMKEIAAQFESATGHKLVFRFGTTPELIKLATTGGPFDLGVVREVFKDAAVSSVYVRAIDIARVGLGVAVRWVPLSQTSAPDALRQTLLKAIHCVDLKARRVGSLRVFERLGIGEAMKAKMKAQAAPAQLVQAVASGDAELGVFLTNVLTAPGLDLVGPFPAEVQQEVVFIAAAAASTKQPEAKAFVPIDNPRRCVIKLG